jgi:hypothetical protein
LLQWHAENAKGNPKIIHATERCAAGIIQAIGHFNLGPNTSPRDITNFSDSELENVSASSEIVKFFLFYERWRRAEVENCEIYLASVKADCVCLLSSFSFDSTCFSRGLPDLSFFPFPCGVFIEARNNHVYPFPLV